MINYSNEVEQMCVVAKGPKHAPAPIPEEGKWVFKYDLKIPSATLPRSFFLRVSNMNFCPFSLYAVNSVLQKLNVLPRERPREHMK